MLHKHRSKSGRRPVSRSRNDHGQDLRKRRVRLHARRARGAAGGAAVGHGRTMNALRRGARRRDGSSWTRALASRAYRHFARLKSKWPAQGCRATSLRTRRAGAGDAVPMRSVGIGPGSICTRASWRAAAADQRRLNVPRRGARRCSADRDGGIRSRVPGEAIAAGGTA